MLEILFITFRQYGLFECLLHVIDNFNLACKFDVLFDMIVSVFDGTVSLKQIIIRQFKIINCLFC